jgi:hypothetical protein
MNSANTTNATNATNATNTTNPTNVKVFLPNASAPEIGNPSSPAVNPVSFLTQSIESMVMQPR